MSRRPKAERLNGSLERKVTEDVLIQKLKPDLNG